MAARLPPSALRSRRDTKTAKVSKERTPNGSASYSTESWRILPRNTSRRGHPSSCPANTTPVVGKTNLGRSTTQRRFRHPPSNFSTRSNKTRAVNKHRHPLPPLLLLLNISKPLPLPPPLLHLNRSINNPHPAMLRNRSTGKHPHRPLRHNTNRRHRPHRSTANRPTTFRSRV